MLLTAGAPPNHDLSDTQLQHMAGAERRFSRVRRGQALVLDHSLSHTIPSMSANEA
jgi:hypothetical protein